MLKVRDESSMEALLPAPDEMLSYARIRVHQWPHVAQMLRRKLSKIELRPEDREEVGRPGACHALILASWKLAAGILPRTTDGTRREAHMKLHLQTVMHL